MSRSRTPLPDAQRQDFGNGSGDACALVEHDLTIGQFGGRTAPVQVVIGLQVVEVGVRSEEGDHRNGKRGDRRDIDIFAAVAVTHQVAGRAGLIMHDRVNTSCQRPYRYSHH